MYFTVSFGVLEGIKPKMFWCWSSLSCKTTKAFPKWYMDSHKPGFFEHGTSDNRIIFFRFFSVASDSGNLGSKQDTLQRVPSTSVVCQMRMYFSPLGSWQDRLVRKWELTLLFVWCCLCSVFPVAERWELLGLRVSTDESCRQDCEADALLRHRSSCRQRQRSCGFLGE